MITWRKLPSVTRENKFFYRATENRKDFTVLQSWYSGLWEVRYDGLTSPEFKTAKQAMKFAENLV